MIKVENTQGIAWVTINRPDSRNAMNSQVLAEVSASLDELYDDDDAQLLIFTGAGERPSSPGPISMSSPAGLPQMA